MRMELTSPGPSNEVDTDKRGAGTDTNVMESVEALETEGEPVESGGGESSKVPSTDEVNDDAVGQVEDLAEREIDHSEADPDEEDLVEEAELEPEPRKAHSEDLDSDERLSPGMSNF